ncbi:hypothetical protein LCGC14_2358180 [marine sediment metagenome]|uniref:Uncharacterized protein n=1 Tax=marine sediment metagenome TaxID=412755 RepID=A0A0F9F284_9ZZZZ
MEKGGNVDLSTKQGINDFILNELGYVKGLIVNLYKRNRNNFDFSGYEREDLIQESYLWLIEKLKKEDKTDEEYIKKSITLYIKNKMANLLRNCMTHQKKITYSYGDSNDDKNSIQLLSASKMDNSLKLSELEHLCTPVEYEIVKKYIVEKKSFREVAKEMSKKGHKMSKIWSSILFHRAIYKFRKSSHKII